MEGKKVKLIVEGTIREKQGNYVVDLPKYLEGDEVQVLVRRLNGTNTK